MTRSLKLTRSRTWSRWDRLSDRAKVSISCLLYTSQGEIQARVARNERVLVTTLTIKMAEDLTEYLRKAGIRTKYMHHSIKTIERTEIIRDLRLGTFDVLVGINLLREGLDLPCLLYTSRCV